MAHGGPADLQIEYDDDGSPGSLVDITQHVITFNGVSIESMIEEVRSFGDSWDEHLPIGVGKIAPIEFGGLLDDAADGPDDLFANRVPESPNTPTRTFKVTWFGTKTTAFETILVKYDRTPDKNALHKYTVTLQPTGSPTEA
jgi:hypothetical protein